MAYVINRTDGSVLTEINDNNIDRVTTDLTLVGRSSSNYGEGLNENFVKLLENFASNTQPNRPVKGQLWYDSSENRLKVYDGLTFKISGGPVISNTIPNNLIQGDIWINPQTRQMYFSDGTNRILVGPDYSNEQGLSGQEVDSVNDIFGNRRTIVKFRVNGVVLGIFSRDTFTPNYLNESGRRIADEGFSGELVKGFNSNPTLADMKFDVTAAKALSLVDEFGVVKSTANFVVTDNTSTITNGSLKIQTQVPLVLGPGDNNEIRSTNSIFEILSNSINQDFDIRIRDTTSTVSAFYINSVDSRIGIFNQNPETTLDVNGSMTLRGNFVTDQTTISILPTTASTVNFASQASTLIIGATTGTTTVRTANTVINGDLSVNGGDLTTTADVFNLLPLTNNKPLTINFGTNVNEINIGSVNTAVEIPGDFTVNGTMTVIEGTQIDDISIIGHTISASLSGNNLILDSFSGIVESDKDFLVNGDITADNLILKSQSLKSNAAVFNLLSDTTLLVNFASESTNVNIGADTGFTTIRNILRTNSNIQILGNTVSSSVPEFNLLNTSTIVNAFTSGTNVTIGALTGTTTIRNANTVITGDLAVNGGDIRTNRTTFTIANDVAQTVALGGAATNIEIGAPGISSFTNIKNNLNLTGSFNIESNTMTTSVVGGGFNLFNTGVLRINLGGAATEVNIGANTGTTQVRNDLLIIGRATTGSLVVDNLTDGRIPFVTAGKVIQDSNNFTFFEDLLNLNGNFRISGGIISPNPQVLLNQNTRINGSLQLDGDLSTILTTVAMLNQTVQTINFGGAATALTIGATTGTATIRNATTTIIGNANINGGTLATTATTFNLINTTATTVNFAGASTALTIGATTGTVTLRNALTRVSGNLLPAWKLVNANYNALAGDRLFVDTTSQAITVTLPASPTVGDYVKFVDASQNGFDSGNLLISRNGQKINGANFDLVVGTEGAAFTLIYSGANRGWVYDNQPV